MALWQAFTGGAYRDRSATLDAEAAINLFVSTIQSAGNAKKTALVGTPGLKPNQTLGDVSCRGLWSEDGRTFCATGSTLYELDVTAGTAITRGTIANDGKPVQFASNGRGGEQLAVLSAGNLYILRYTTNVFTGPVSLPLTNAPTQIAFLDGYFLLLEANTVKVWFSALEDGSSWSGSDFFARSTTSDNLIGIAVLRDRIWCFGSQSTDVYYDSGDSDNPFVPYPGSSVTVGAVSPYAIATIGGTLVWLAQSATGNLSIMAASDPPQTLSTPAIAFALASYATVADAEVLVYEQEGHQFAAFTFPSADVTWVIDLVERQWHQRGQWDVPLAVFHRWRARGCCAVNGEIVVGDYATGNVFTLDLDTFTDNGEMIRRVRRAPYISAEATYGFIDQIELQAEVGVGLTTGQGSAPQAMMRCSKDSAHTWSGAVHAPLGAIGRWDNRVIWRRIGRTRMDRFVLEIAVTDAVRTVWGPGLNLRITQGNGQL